jgi:hypothetical protein
VTRGIIDTLDVKPEESLKQHITVKFVKISPSTAMSKLRALDPQRDGNLLRGVTAVVNDTPGTLKLSAPPDDRLKEVMKQIREIDPEATEVKPTDGR